MGGALCASRRLFIPSFRDRLIYVVQKTFGRKICVLANEGIKEGWSKMSIEKLRKRIESCYSSYRVKIKLVPVKIERRQIVFGIRIRKGTREKLVLDYARDVQVALGIPVFEVLRQGLTLYLMVSGKSVKKCYLAEMFENSEFYNKEMKLPLAIGCSKFGEMQFADLKEMPHIMYAGATNSGKSQGIRCLLLSLIKRCSVEEVNFLLFDTCSDTMDIFEELPYLSYPVVRDVETGVYVLKMLGQEMERRRKLKREERERCPEIVCVIDELASFVDELRRMKYKKEGIGVISSVLQHGRHSNVHLVVGVQDPAMKNIDIEASNITARVAFRCAKHQNSSTILGETGAESLSEKGEMLFKTSEMSVAMRLQGAYMEVDDMLEIVENVKNLEYDADRKFVIPEFQEEEDFLDFIEIPEKDDNESEMAKIFMWVLSKDRVSANKLKEKFEMGNRVDGIMEKLHMMGIISDKKAKQPRKVIPQTTEEVPEEVKKLLMRNHFTVEDISEVMKNRAVACT